MLSISLARFSALFLLVASIALAATPTSFCKCICFKEYKIIPLDAPATSPNAALKRSLLSSRDDEDSGLSDDHKSGTEYHRKTCNDCNKVFCLEQNLPECKNAEDKDVSAQCFQRDSSKDEAVVFIFIFATMGLLAWAIVKPFADKWMEKVRERGQYIPVSGEAR